jgi:hypothetical protein
VQVCPVGHGLPQSPQFDGSLRVSAQPFPQLAWPILAQGSAASQRPSRHASPVAQA